MLLNFGSNKIIAQNTDSKTNLENVKISYEEWLKESTLNKLFEVADVIIESKNISLHLDGKSIHDPKILALSWNAINDSLAIYDSDLALIMLQKLSNVSGFPAENCKLSLQSQNKNIFSIKASYENGVIETEENLVLIRGEKELPFIEIALVLDNPSGTLICKDDLKNCKAKVGKVLKKYFKNEYKVDSDDLIPKEVNLFHDQYTIEDIKNVITDRYNERIVFDFNFKEDGKLVIIEYEITGWFASGFNSKGKYRDLRTSYYSELVGFEEPFERFFKSKL
ncbi:MAG: hypothetical protein AAF363_12515 [Bacteroidota bacterium]